MFREFQGPNPPIWAAHTYSIPKLYWVSLLHILMSTHVQFNKFIQFTVINVFNTLSQGCCHKILSLPWGATLALVALDTLTQTHQYVTSRYQPLPHVRILDEQANSPPR